MFYVYFSSVIFLIWNITFIVCLNQPEVTIDQGVVRGLYTKTFGNREISSFLGIPYAKPPSGKHRFKESVPPLPWIGVYNATKAGPPCLQLNHLTYNTPFAVQGSEDCLYVNVFTPKVPTGKEQQKLLDVIAFIHGGAFMFLSADFYMPDILLDRDVVLVSFNYRLGPLGFLSTEDNVVPGNNGLKDQVLALKWIQNNIAAFGGDPRSVTIAGLSAGGASVHYHLLSPLSKGLFKGAMPMSGVSLNPWTVAENPKEKAMYIADKLGCPTNDSHLMIRCLRNRPAEHIVGLSSDFFKYLYNPYSPFGPVVEPASPNAFISDTPINILAQGLSHDVPILGSFTSEEGLYPGAEIVGQPKNLETLKQNLDSLLPHILDFNYTVPLEEQKQISLKIIEHYKINLNEKTGIANFIKVLGDRLFVHGIVKALKLHATLNTSPVYLYKFSYRGKYSVSSFFTEEDYGVSHADDLFYILFSPVANTRETESDRILSDKMVDLWVNFAANGTLDSPWSPMHQHLPQISFVEVLGPDNLKQSLADSLGEEEFWDSLGINENIESTVKRDEL